MTMHEVEYQVVNACRGRGYAFDGVERIGKSSSDLVDALLLVEMVIVERCKDVGRVVLVGTRGRGPAATRGGKGTMV